jgi:hypothetical protein
MHRSQQQLLDPGRYDEASCRVRSDRDLGREPGGLGRVDPGECAVELALIVRTDVGRLEQVVDEGPQAERRRDAPRRGMGLLDEPGLLQLREGISDAGRRERNRHLHGQDLGRDGPRPLDVGRDERPQDHRLTFGERRLEGRAVDHRSCAERLPVPFDRNLGDAA